MNQVDEDVLPAPIIQDGLDNPLLIEGGDVWEMAGSGDVYSGYFRSLHR